NRWNGLIQAINTYVSGVELDQVSLHDLANYADSHVNWRIAEGYGTTIAAHAAMVPMALDCPAHVLDHGGARITVDTAKGKLTADQAIVTLPTSLLADGALTFTPALPGKIEAAGGLPLGLAAKLFLSLDKAEEFPKDSRLFGHQDRAATGAYHMRPFGRPQIEVYFGGAHAWHLEAGGETAFFDFAVS